MDYRAPIEKRDTDDLVLIIKIFDDYPPEEIARARKELIKKIFQNQKLRAETLN